MTAYFVDNAGSDSNSGLAGHPWQTCSKVTSFSASPGFAPGDTIAFTAGQTFAGPLIIVNSGSSGGGYICVGTGRGSTPPTLPSGGIPQSNPAIITIADGNATGVAFNDCSYAWIDNISVVGSGVNHTTGVTTSTALGISFKSTQATTRLSNCIVTACSASECLDGIAFWVSDTTKVGFDTFKIWGCSTQYTQITSIAIINYNYGNRFGATQGTAKDTFTNAYIGYSTVDHCMGDTTDAPTWAGTSLLMWNTTTGLLEHCASSNINPTRAGADLTGPGGVQTAYSDQVTFDTVESTTCHSTFANSRYSDGEAFETDAGVTNFTMQYCYGHDCDGPGLLIGQGTVRYCVLANNMNKAAVTLIGNLPGELTQGVNQNGYSGALVAYGNTIYAPRGDCYATEASGSFGAPSLYNNILVCKAGSNCVNAGGTVTALVGNCYFALGGGTISVKPSATTYTSLTSLQAANWEVSSGRNYGAFADPALSNPGGAPATPAVIGGSFPTITYFDITLSSPAAKLGFNVVGGVGTQDFHGNDPGSGGLYDAGAVEISANAARHGLWMGR